MNIRQIGHLWTKLSEWSREGIRLVICLMFFFANFGIHTLVDQNFGSKTSAIVTSAFISIIVYGSSHLLTSWEKIIQHLLKVSTIDSLTGCYNRNFFDQEIENIEASILRNKQTVTVFVADLDNFKSVNDTYGHASGDLALKAVANKLKRIFRRGEDFVIRPGGDEFVIICPCESKIIEKRVREETRSITFFDKNSVEISISCSIGVNTLQPKEPGFLNKMLIKADEAMYHSKNNKKN